MNGTASLANGEIGRVLPANDRKVLFSGAVEHLNEAATAPYFGDLSGESPETRTAWRMTQSGANPSLVRNSLLNRENTGKFLALSHLSRDRYRKNILNLGAYREIPYSQ
jgi:hypothetical protein